MSSGTLPPPAASSLPAESDEVAPQTPSAARWDAILSLTTCARPDLPSGKLITRFLIGSAIAMAPFAIAMLFSGFVELSAEAVAIAGAFSLWLLLPYSVQGAAVHVDRGAREMFEGGEPVLLALGGHDKRLAYGLASGTLLLSLAAYCGAIPVLALVSRSAFFPFPRLAVPLVVLMTLAVSLSLWFAANRMRSEPRTWTSRLLVFGPLAAVGFLVVLMRAHFYGAGLAGGIAVAIEAIVAAIGEAATAAAGFAVAFEYGSQTAATWFSIATPLVLSALMLVDTANTFSQIAEDTEPVPTEESTGRGEPADRGEPLRSRTPTPPKRRRRVALPPQRPSQSRLELSAGSLGLDGQPIAELRVPDASADWSSDPELHGESTSSTRPRVSLDDALDPAAIAGERVHQPPPRLRSTSSLTPPPRPPRTRGPRTGSGVPLGRRQSRRRDASARRRQKKATTRRPSVRWDDRPLLPQWDARVLPWATTKRFAIAAGAILVVLSVLAVLTGVHVKFLSMWVDVVAVVLTVAIVVVSGTAALYAAFSIPRVLLKEQLSGGVEALQLADITARQLIVRSTARAALSAAAITLANVLPLAVLNVAYQGLPLEWFLGFTAYAFLLPAAIAMAASVATVRRSSDLVVALHILGCIVALPLALVLYAIWMTLAARDYRDPREEQQ